MHPSLNAPVRFDHLFPEEKPKNPYSPCWCQSGKKWKFCHKTREFEALLHEGEFKRLIRKNYNHGACLHPNAGNGECTAPAINSHTIQMRGGISTISENHHVYTFKHADTDENFTFTPAKISNRRASTFLGFCNKHDTELFKCIETEPLEITKKTAFYMAFRALSYEYHGKLRGQAATPLLEQTDRGKPFVLQAILQSRAFISKQGLIAGVKLHEDLKNHFDLAHIKEDYKDFDFFAIEFDRPSPVVCCGSFCPEFDILGTPLQSLSRGDFDFQIMTLNVLNINGKSYAVFGWLKNIYDVAVNYIDTIRISPANLLADLILKIVFQNLENSYLSPSWWDHLTPSDKKCISDLFGTGLLAVPKTAESLHTPTQLWAAEVIGVISSLNLEI